MTRSKSPKLELHSWYKTRQGTFCMLVLEYPWYHFRRFIQGYRWRDDLGFKRRKKGNLKFGRKCWGDIVPGD